MEGPEAAVWAASIIGGFVAIITAMIRWKPRTHFNGKGELLAKAVEVAEMRGRLAVLEQVVAKESEYTHGTIHTIRNDQHAMQLKLAIMDQKLDNICERLRMKRKECDE